MYTPPNPPSTAWKPEPDTVNPVRPEVDATAPPSELDAVSRAAAFAGASARTASADVPSSASARTASIRTADARIVVDRV